MSPAVTAMPAAGLTKPLRTERLVTWGKSTPPLGWSRFLQVRGGKWEAAWDSATGVPTRIWGPGIPAPGTTTSAAAAESFARQMLADHLALLAPGAAIRDFVLASNHFDGAIRSVGFFQRALGRRVVGGQVSFRFKADRLFVIGSEALPSVTVKTPRSRLALSLVRSRAAASLRVDLALPAGQVSPLGDELVLPLVADDAVLGYRLVRSLEIDGGADGRYLAYADVGSGAVLAVRQLNTYATGTVLYHAVDRYPARPRVDLPAPFTHVIVNGTPQTTNGAGAVEWSPDAEAAVETSITGMFAIVANKATGNALASAVFALQPSGAFAWDASATEHDDAQVNAYIATLVAKDYVRVHIDPAMPTIDDQMIVNVNIANQCNAFFDGKTINFFQSSMQCQNTALLSDVVYHEYGHRLHTAEIIAGVGDFDGAMSEGASDFLAASITNDSGMGRGFFHTDEALRELDPAEGKEWYWPQDVGEVHHTGMIYGGVFWDLRKALIAEKGEAAGITLVNKLYVGTMRRAINIPTSLIEALAEDDDDGNLENGTPNECAIRAAFGRHGLRSATGVVLAPGQLTVNALAIGIQVEVSGLSERCTGDEVVGAQLDWFPPYTGVPQAGSADATPAGLNKFFAQLPLSPQESVSYKVRVKFVDGSTLTLADNFADPYYQLYQGRTVKLYCTDFETDPFADGWTTGADDGRPSPFAWGTPGGGASDPQTAFSGEKILAQGLGGDYLEKQRAWVKMPTIDIGQYSDVRLHYRRWLSAEDSHFDQAQITANDKKAWINYTSDEGDASAIHHIDREWRFHDVPLSPWFFGHSLTVSWELTSDEGLELGGWQMDDVCIVANPYAICGDGVRTPTEQCDNGAANSDVADTCRTYCRAPTCGDGITDTGEACDDGAAGTATCSASCTTIDAIDGGCCSTSGGPGSLPLGGLVGVLLLRRRRARKR